MGATLFTGRTTHAITAPASVAGAGTRSLVTNTTAVAPTSPTFLTMWAEGLIPTVSNLNAATAQTVANATITSVGQGNVFRIYNDNGAVNVVVDVVGTMESIPNTVPVALARAAAAGPRTWTGSATTPHPARTLR